MGLFPHEFLVGLFHDENFFFRIFFRPAQNFAYRFFRISIQIFFFVITMMKKSICKVLGWPKKKILEKIFFVKKTT